MKKILSLILVMIAFHLQSVAQESPGRSSTVRIELETQQKNNSNHPVHRAPIRVNIEAYYNEENGTLEICYDGEATGEAFLYLNDNIVGYSSEINTTFQIEEPGIYRIEILGESWIAEGSLQV